MAEAESTVHRWLRMWAGLEGAEEEEAERYAKDLLGTCMLSLLVSRSSPIRAD